MKKILVLFALSALAAPVTQANECQMRVTSKAAAQIAVSIVSPFDLINWKVGDSESFNLSVGSFLKGTMTEVVTKDDGDGSIWMQEIMDLTVQKETVDTQLNKATGKIMKMLVNGQEQQIPDETVTIISQDYTEITVPKGTFKAMHIVAKSAQSDHIEMWANPAATAVSGTIKMISATQLGDMTMELTDFHKTP